MSLKEKVCAVAACAPPSLWKLVPGDAPLFPYYHMVSAGEVEHVSPLYQFRTPEAFESDLEHFLRIKRPMTLAEVIGGIVDEGRPPGDGFLVTFDDGFSEMHDIAMPVLQRKGVPAVFFLNSATVDNRTLGFHQKIALLVGRREQMGGGAFDVEAGPLLSEAGIGGGLLAIPWGHCDLVDRIAAKVGIDFEGYLARVKPYLDSDQVRSMLDAGFDIGAHSVDHPLYRELSLSEQLAQTRDSMQFLDEQFALRHRAFAFPHTDRGVGPEFFQQVFDEGIAEITFGTAGPQHDGCARSVQRFSMEKTRSPAGAILVRNRLKRLRLGLSGKLLLKR